jgi:alpha-tubulin suppressor-like RCC1 family protein
MIVSFLFLGEHSLGCGEDHLRRIPRLSIDQHRMKPQHVSTVLLFSVCPLFDGALMAQGIAAGSGHSIAVCADGTVQNWGFDHHGQLGIDATSDANPIPVSPTGLTDVAAVAGGTWFTLALHNDGTVEACGWNQSGELGDGTWSPHHVHEPVINLADVAAVRAGSIHSLALKSDGTLWAWGDNDDGQLGDGTTTDRNIPVQVDGLTDNIAMDAGYYHSLAVRSDGTVWAWGSNQFGQLGDGSVVGDSIPVQVQGLTDVMAVEAGAFSSYALKTDSTVWAWGGNGSGQLGDGTTTEQHLPVQVIGLSGITAISSFFVHAMALKEDGTVWLWGQNNSGQLGDGTLSNAHAPFQLSSPTGVTAIATGSLFSMALENDGTLWAWGQNVAGQLGNGLVTTDSLTPGMVTGLCSMATQLAPSIDEGSLQVFPNPSPGRFTVRSDGEQADLRIRNMIGQVVYRARTKGQAVEVDLASQPSGMYCVTLRTNDGVITQRVIKE